MVQALRSRVLLLKLCQLRRRMARLVLSSAWVRSNRSTALGAMYLMAWGLIATGIHMLQFQTVDLATTVAWLVRR